MEYVRKDLIHAYLQCGRNKALSADVIHGLIEQIPTADVRENEHSEWIRIAPDMIKCRKCHSFIRTAFDNVVYDFCPNCGAEMRGIDDGK